MLWLYCVVGVGVVTIGGLRSQTKLTFYFIGDEHILDVSTYMKPKTRNESG